MALTFKSPDEVREEYLVNLKILKPGINKDQTDSDWYIRGQVIGGVMSGAYADQLKLADDAFPQKARHEALDRFLFVYFNGTFKTAQQSSGKILFSGTVSSTLSAGTQLVYSPNGNSYQVVSNVVLTAATGEADVISLNSGQSQNLLENTILTISTPPAGINGSATALFPGISDGRNSETDGEASQRILDRIRAPSAGGTANDYRGWALAANPSVTSASIVRWIYGLGTVGIFITSGTTDIDAALNNGDPVVRLPSQSLIDIVQAYIEALKPITDCAFVFAPSEAPQDVTVRVRYNAGLTGDSIISGQTLTCRALVQREVARALYKTPAGGRKIGPSGYMLASEIEEVIDIGLSNTDYEQGIYAQILIDRQVLDLSATGTNRLLLNNQLMKPGTIQVVEE